MTDAVRTKPRLLFLQYRYDEKLPAFLLLHKQDHVKCLSRSFDVTVVSEDCDYGEVCERHHPDVVLFESGVNHVTCRRLDVANTHAHPGIPKLALHNADPFCNARAGFLSDIEHWGIDAVFAISTTAAEHTPELADLLYVWPNFVDPAIYRDYGASKSIPVLLTGNANALYPWRQKISRLVSGRYPSLLCPHPGYDPDAAAVSFLFGERYARTINASLTVPACGTIARELVRKHLEVPACRACLVTERSAALDAAGFADMESCVFADEHDVLDKLEHLFRNPELLQGITDAGHRLVHGRHTLEHRGQILQWYELRRDLAPGHEIVQPGPFEPLVAMRRRGARERAGVAGGGLHLELIRRGDRMLEEGRTREAEALYLQSKGYMPWMPEPRLRVALCRLLLGDARTALAWIEELLTFVLVEYGARDPDPVEWAYRVVSLLCLGRREEALRDARQFAWLRHPELDRARWSAAILAGVDPEPPPGADGAPRRTLHRLPGRGDAEWVERVCAMLLACGRRPWAEILRARSRTGTALPSPPAGRGERAAGAGDERPGSGAAGTSPSPSSAASTTARLERRLRIRRLRSAVRRTAGVLLHAVERRTFPFLPYRLSGARDDPFYRTIQQLTAEEDLRTALVVGAPGARCAAAFLAGAGANPNAPSVCFVETPAPRLLRATLDGGGAVRRWQLRTGASGAGQLEEAIGRVGRDAGITSFDAVLIDGFAARQHLRGATRLAEILSGARLVFLEDTNELACQEVRDRLLADPELALVASDPALRGGFAAFRRRRRRAAEA